MLSVRPGETMVEGRFSRKRMEHGLHFPLLIFFGLGQKICFVLFLYINIYIKYMKIVYLIDKKRYSINIQLNKFVLCQLWLFLTSSWRKHTHSILSTSSAQSSVCHWKRLAVRWRQCHKLQSSHTEWTDQHSKCLFLVFMVLRSLWHRSKGCFRHFNMLFATCLPLFFFVHSILLVIRVNHLTSRSCHLLSAEALVEGERCLWVFFKLCTCKWHLVSRTYRNLTEESLNELKTVKS